ncbi:MAG: hypothetical protein ABJB10_19190, partial [Mesorhizobium sp.]
MSEAGGSGGEVRKGYLRLSKVLDNVAVSHNRASDQVRKKREVRAKKHDIGLSRNCATINVDQVGQCLEGEKGYADWQNDAIEEKGGERKVS